MEIYLQNCDSIEETINVKDLIEILKKYPQDMKVITTWEDSHHVLKEENIYESKDGYLFFDCDDNFYKKDFMK